jgi:hypothetical protein
MCQKAKEEKLVAVAGDHMHNNAKASIVDIAAKVENEQWETVRKPAETLRVLTKTIHGTLHKDLKLSNKSTRWFPELTYKEMKKERVRMCKAFIATFASVS